MKIKYLLVSISIIFVFISCKKETKTAAPPPNNNTQTNLLSGGFMYQQAITKTLPSSSVSTVIFPTAFFFNPAIDPNNTFGVTYADVGSVSVNSIVLQKVYMSPGQPAYSDSTGLICSTPVSVSISGKNGFSATSFTDNNFPSFSNFNQLPASISKSAGFTITLNNLVHTTAIEVTFNQVTLSSLSNSVTFTPAQLSNMTVNSNMLLKIKCTNSAYLPYYQGGKNFSNTYVTQYFLYGVLVQA